MCSGANAARILASLGVLDAVLAKTQEPGLTMGSFAMKSGMDEHQLIYEVRILGPEVRHSLTIIVTLFTTQYPWIAEDDGVGAHR